MIKKVLSFAISLLLVTGVSGQDDEPVSSSEKMLDNGKSMLIGGYGNLDYNQQIDPNIGYNGIMDVHCLVLFFGYNFDSKVSFVTEIELEHVKEVYVEQAFMQYKIHPALKFRAGLLLVPMGYVNEYHEPTLFNGVEKPLTEKYLSPTTWREMGTGFTGNFPQFGLKYQAYFMNGFISYNDESTLSGEDGLRNGRQKGAKSIFHHPSFAGKLKWSGLPGLALYLSYYTGKTQSSLYDEINKNDNTMMDIADSSVVGISMIGAGGSYTSHGLSVLLQYYHTSINNVSDYNNFTSTSVGPNDLASAMNGYAAEVAYNLMPVFCSDTKHQLITFVRYEKVNRHYEVMQGSTINKSLNFQVLTGGLGWKLNSAVVLKADFQQITDDNGSTENFINGGVGIMF